MRGAPPLRPRLRAVAELVPRGGRVADVGTEHGRLPRWLLAAGRASFCLAVDRREDAVRRLAAEARSWGLAGRLEVRRGHGLAAVRPEDRIDTVTVSGLGARVILELLDREAVRRLGLERLVLQPQTEPARLRRALQARGFEIQDERLAREGRRFYPVIAAGFDPPRPGPALPEGTEEELLWEAGPWLLSRAEEPVLAYWRQQVAFLEALARRTRGSRGEAEALERLALARRILALLERRRL